MHLARVFAVRDSGKKFTEAISYFELDQAEWFEMNYLFDVSMET